MKTYETALVLSLAFSMVHGSVLLAQYYHISGYVTDPDGDPVWRIDIDVEDSATGDPLEIADDHTDPNGYYDIVLPQGTFDIEYNAPSGVKLSSAIRREVQVSSDLVIDIQLENGWYLSGRVTDQGGSGVGQVDLDVDDVETGLRIPTPRDDTDMNGDYQIVVPAGLFDVTYEPPPGLRLVAVTMSDVEITDDTMIDVSLENGFFVSGWVVDESGVGIPEVDLDAVGLEYGNTIPTPRDNSDTDGYYSIVLPGGAFSILFDPINRDDLAASRLDTVTVTEDSVLDTVTLHDGVHLSGNTTDFRGDPVVNADLDVLDMSVMRVLPTPGDNTDENGDYRVTIVTGTYDLIMKPPEGSGLAEKRIPSVTVGNDTVVDFVLEDDTGIDDPSDVDGGRVPGSFLLSQNFPNPFNPRTTIVFTVPEDRGRNGQESDCPVRLEIYDMRGRRISVLIDEEMSPGEYRVSWNGRDQEGTPVVSGTYFYRYLCGSGEMIRKMTVLK